MQRILPVRYRQIGRMERKISGRKWAEEMWFGSKSLSSLCFSRALLWLSEDAKSSVTTLFEGQ